MKRRRWQIDLGPAEMAPMSGAGPSRSLPAGIEDGFTLALVPRGGERFPHAAVELTEAVDPERRSPAKSPRSWRGPSAGAPINKEACLEVLRRERPALESIGVRHAALFGSVARDRARTDSDVDVLIDVDPNSHMDLFDVAAVRERLVAAFGREVDIVTKAALKSNPDDAILREAVYAF